MDILDWIPSQAGDDVCVADMTYWRIIRVRLLPGIMGFFDSLRSLRMTVSGIKLNFCFCRFECSEKSKSSLGVVITERGGFRFGFRIAGQLK